MPEIKSFYLDGPAGKLEAILNSGADDPPFCAVVTHPHPLFGGTMHNKVVYNAMKSLQSFGLPCLRFNFRGTGSSEGKHDEGKGEQGDVQAALDWLASEFKKPILFAGFSFGCAVGSKVAGADDRVKGLICLGTPVQAAGRNYSFGFLNEVTKPKLFVSGDHDEFSPEPVLRDLFERVPEPKRVVIVPDADHFFEKGKLPIMKQAVEQWVKDTFGLQQL